VGGDRCHCDCGCRHVVSSTEIIATDWDVSAAGHLDGLGGYSAAHFKALYGAGTVNVFGIHELGKRIGTLLLQWSRDKESNELTVEVLALAGSGDADLTAEVLVYIEEKARLVGAKSLVLNTERPGLVRKLAAKANDGVVTMGWRL